MCLSLVDLDKFDEEYRVISTVVKHVSDMSHLEKKIIAASGKISIINEQELIKLKETISLLNFQANTMYKKCNHRIKSLIDSKENNQYKSLSLEIELRDSLITRIEVLLDELFKNETDLCYSNGKKLRPLIKTKGLIEAYNYLRVENAKKVEIVRLKDKIPPDRLDIHLSKMGSRVKIINEMPLDRILRSEGCNFYVLEKVEYYIDDNNQKKEKREWLEEIYPASTREEIEMIRLCILAELKRKIKNPELDLEIIMVPKRNAVPFYNEKYAVIYDKSSKEIISISKNIREWRKNKIQTFSGGNIAYSFLTPEEIEREFRIILKPKEKKEDIYPDEFTEEEVIVEEDLENQCAYSIVDIDEKQSLIKFDEFVLRHKHGFTILDLHNSKENFVAAVNPFDLAKIDINEVYMNLEKSGYFLFTKKGYTDINVKMPVTPSDISAPNEFVRGDDGFLSIKR